MQQGYKEIDLGKAKKSEEQVLKGVYTNYDRRMQALLARVNLPETDPRRIAPENLRAARKAAEKEFGVYADSIVKKELGEEAWRAMGKGDGILGKIKTMESEAARAVEDKIAAARIKQKTPQVAEFQEELRARFKTSGRASQIEAALEHCGKQIDEKGWTMQRVEEYLIANRVVSPEEYNKIIKIARTSGFTTDAELKNVLMFIAPTPETAKAPWKERFFKGAKAALFFDAYDVGNAAEAVKGKVGEFREDPAKAARSARRKLAAFGGLGVVTIAGAVIAYLILSSDEEAAAPSTTQLEQKPKIIDKFTAVDDSLKDTTGRKAKLILEGSKAEDYSVRITAEVRKITQNPEEQKRIFTLFARMYQSYPAFKELIKNNQLPIENVPLLIPALHELQKCGLPVEQLAGIAVNIAVNYDSTSYAQVSKDIAIYLSKNGKMARNVEAATADPAKFSATYGKLLKHTYKPSLIWSRRPFDAFLSAEEPRFSSKSVKELVPGFSELIRATFGPEDQEAVAKGFAGLYRAATGRDELAEINAEYKDHVKFLKQIREKGFSIGESFEILLAIEKNVATVAAEAGPWSNLGGYSKQIVLGRLLEGARRDPKKTWDEAKEDMMARLAGILKDSPSSWTMKSAPLFHEVEITPLMGFLDQTKLSNRQKAAAIDAVKRFFNPDFQLWLIEGVVPKKGAPEGMQLAEVAARLAPGMSETEIIDEIHALGFERARNWTSEGWDTYLDPEIRQYFEETDKRNTGGMVARRQHMALTNGQYMEERQLLIDFANQWSKENRTGAIPPALLLAKAKQAFLIEREAATRDLDYAKKLELMPQSIDPKELDARVQSIETGAGEKEEPKPKRRKHR